MSKLDELDGELFDKIPNHFTGCKNVCCHLQIRTYEIIKPLLKSAYDLGKLEEREAPIEHCSVPNCPECNIVSYNKGREDEREALKKKIESLPQGEGIPGVLDILNELNK